MAMFLYPEIFLFTLIIIFLCVWRSRKNFPLPTNWPLFGMLPAIFQNFHRIHAYTTEILIECGSTFEFKSLWFSNLDTLVTSDPANVHHIFSKKFSNYPKGPEFKNIFEIFGDGMFNVDFELWEFHRKTTLSFMSHIQFRNLLERVVWEKVENGLIPVLDHYSEQGSDADMQDILKRFSFDGICKLVLDYDPHSLCTDMPYVACEKAFDDVIEAVLYRHILPKFIWKLQKWLQVGKERKLIQAWKSFDEFIYPCITANKKEGQEQDDDLISLLATYRKAFGEKYGSNFCSRDNFLRDTVLTLMFAGRDTTSTCLTWLFWLIATNPAAEIKIREEIETKLLSSKDDDKKWRFFTMEESRKLIYLHGALCESLRLFPPGALEHKAPIQDDILPSGHFIRQNTRVLISFYSMGRMEAIWGEDCLKFMPERWISANGGIKHEPSYKFPAFNVGPRTCLGKEMAFFQMKMVAAAVIYHYNIQLVEGHPVFPCNSVVIQAKHGLRVRLSKKDV